MGWSRGSIASDAKFLVEVSMSLLSIPCEDLPMMRNWICRNHTLKGLVSQDPWGSRAALLIFFLKVCSFERCCSLQEDEPSAEIVFALVDTFLVYILWYLDRDCVSFQARLGYSWLKGKSQGLIRTCVKDLSCERSFSALGEVKSD